MDKSDIIKIVKKFFGEEKDFEDFCFELDKEFNKSIRPDTKVEIPMSGFIDMFSKLPVPSKAGLMQEAMIRPKVSFSAVIGNPKPIDIKRLVFISKVDQKDFKLKWFLQV